MLEFVNVRVVEIFVQGWVCHARLCILVIDEHKKSYSVGHPFFVLGSKKKKKKKERGKKHGSNSPSQMTPPPPPITPSFEYSHSNAGVEKIRLLWGNALNGCTYLEVTTRMEHANHCAWQKNDAINSKRQKWNTIRLLHNALSHNLM